MEVCVDNVQSFINAVEAGASRIELCSSLAEGGLTPSVGFFRQVKKIGNVQLFTYFMTILYTRWRFIIAEKIVKIFKTFYIYFIKNLYPYY